MFGMARVLAAGAIVALGMQPMMATAGVVSEGVDGAVVIVNETSGKVTLCNGTVNNGQVNACEVIATISNKTLTGNVQIKRAGGSYVFTAVNGSNGHGVACSVAFRGNGSSSAWSGMCVALVAG